MNNRQVAVIASALSIHQSSHANVEILLERANRIEAHLNAGDEAVRSKLLGLVDEPDDAPTDG